MYSHRIWPNRRFAQTISWWNSAERVVVTGSMVPASMRLLLFSAVLVVDHDSVSMIPWHHHHHLLPQHWLHLAKHLWVVHELLAPLQLLQSAEINEFFCLNHSVSLKENQKIHTYRVVLCPSRFVCRVYCDRNVGLDWRWCCRITFAVNNVLLCIVAFWQNRQNCTTVFVR